MFFLNTLRLLVPRPSPSLPLKQDGRALSHPSWSSTQSYSQLGNALASRTPEHRGESRAHHNIMRTAGGTCSQCIHAYQQPFRPQILHDGHFFGLRFCSSRQSLVRIASAHALVLVLACTLEPESLEKRSNPDTGPAIQAGSGSYLDTGPGLALFQVGASSSSLA